MRKLFWKYFLYVFSITVIAIVIQSTVLLLQYRSSQESWKHSVYDDFVDGIQDHLEREMFLGLGRVNLVSMVSDTWDERISGYVVSDADGNTILSYGKTSNGLQLSGIFPENQRMPDGRGNKKISQKGSINSFLDVRVENGLLNLGFLVERKQATKSDVLNLSVPSSMKADDIIGSVTVTVNGSELFTIHLLTHSFRTYANTREFVNSCLRSMLYATLASIVVALIAAWCVSSNATRYIDGIRRSLKDLANGKTNVKTVHKGNSQLDEIAVAIENLDQDLQANAKSRNAWLNSISHDLNTPASSMKIMIDGMADGVFPADSETLENLRRENDDLLNRIGRVIEFSRLQADVALDVSEIRLGDLLARFDVGAQDNSIIATGDEVLIGRALEEVIGNASSYGEGDVFVMACEDESQYHIVVSNKGSLPEGVNAEDLLQPWYRGDSSRTEGGNGLGLPIAGKIMELHKGSLTLQECDGMVKATLSWQKGLPVAEETESVETPESEGVENNG